MKLPSFALFIVKNGDGKTLLVRRTKNDLWTLPGGNPGRRHLSYTDFAAACIKPHIEAAAVVALKLIGTLPKETFIGNDRSRCLVFLCKAAGVIREKPDNTAWFADIEAIPSHVLASEVRETLAILEAKSKAASS